MAVLLNLAALAWAMINDDLEEMHVAIYFIARQLSPEEIAAADALYGRISEKINDLADDTW